jgi:hypothetical protein
MHHGRYRKGFRKLLRGARRSLYRLELATSRDWQQRVATRELDAPTLSPESSLRRLSVVVTTYEDRQFDFALPLVRSIVDAAPGLPVVVVLNGNLLGDHDPGRRRHFLAQLLDLQNVTCLPLAYFHGLAHNWNLGIRAASSECSLVLNDDLVIDGDGFLRDIEAGCQATTENGLTLIRESFSHFFVASWLSRKVGAFDEAFIGIGEEDGDYAWRFAEAFGHAPPSMDLGSLGHIPAASHGAGVKEGRHSLANYEYVRMKYDFGVGSNSVGFGVPARRRLSELRRPWTSDEWALARTVLGTSDSELIHEFFQGAIGQGFIGWVPQGHGAESKSTP